MILVLRFFGATGGQTFRDEGQTEGRANIKENLKNLKSGQEASKKKAKANPSWEQDERSH